MTSLLSVCASTVDYASSAERLYCHVLLTRSAYKGRGADSSRQQIRPGGPIGREVAWWILPFWGKWQRRSRPSRLVRGRLFWTTHNFSIDPTQFQYTRIMETRGEFWGLAIRRVSIVVHTASRGVGVAPCCISFKNVCRAWGGQNGPAVRYTHGDTMKHTFEDLNRAPRVSTCMPSSYRFHPMVVCALRHGTTRTD